MSSATPLRPFLVTAALALGAVGWAWTAGLILLSLLGLVTKPAADDQQPYPIGLLGDAFAHVNPVDRELLGTLESRIHGRAVCDNMWFDDDSVLIRGIGPFNGGPAPAWMTLTVGSQVFVGRVTVDLWNGIGAGTGGLDSAPVYTVAANLRFIERVPPPRPDPSGVQVIRPGECVLGSTEPQDASGVIGRFLIDLPAKRLTSIGLLGELTGNFVPLVATLSLNGQDVPMVKGDDFRADRYRTERDGRYELTVRRTDGPDAGRVGPWRRYTVEVTWGAPIAGQCEPPDSKSNCFLEVQP